MEGNSVEILSKLACNGWSSNLTMTHFLPFSEFDGAVASFNHPSSEFN